MSRKYFTSGFAKSTRQEGSVLLISLVILIVLTLLTFSSARGVLLQEKMSASTRDSILALEVAEAAVRVAETRVTDPALPYSDEGPTARYCVDGCGANQDQECSSCEFTNVNNDIWADSVWDFSEKVTIEAGSINCGNSDPNCKLYGEYVIIKMGKINLTTTAQGKVQSITSDAVELDNIKLEDMYKYKIIARGSGMDPTNERIIVSYYAAREV